MLNSIQSNESTSPSITGTQSKNETVGKDEFLNLLVTQLKYQDPLNPMDSTQFTAQLAQFSTLEQMTNVNTNLNTLISSQANMSNYQAVSYIGKNVSSYGNTISKTQGESEQMNFELNQNANKVFVQIYDSSGNLLRQYEEGFMNMGTHEYTWDGKDSNGKTVTDGSYNFQVYAYDSNDQKIDATLFTEKKITGITYDNGEIYLNSGDNLISEKSIFKVSES